MNKSIIIYGPQGCGKTVNAERIRKHFGLDRVIDEYTGRRMLYERVAFEMNGVLYLTCMGKAEVAAELELHPHHFSRLMSFAEVAKQINDSIPLTDFQKGTPPVVGEFDTLVLGYAQERRRYWNGKRWSRPFFEEQSQDHKNLRASQATVYKLSDISYRGLSEEPIIVHG